MQSETSYQPPKSTRTNGKVGGEKLESSRSQILNKTGKLVDDLEHCPLSDFRDKRTYQKSDLIIRA